MRGAKKGGPTGVEEHERTSSLGLLQEACMKRKEDSLFFPEMQIESNTNPLSISILYFSPNIM